MPDYDEALYQDPETAALARDIMRRYPQHVRGLSLWEVTDVWLYYSDPFVDGLTVPDDRNVAAVFGGFHAAYAKMARRE